MRSVGSRGMVNKFTVTFEDVFTLKTSLLPVTSSVLCDLFPPPPLFSSSFFSVSQLRKVEESDSALLPYRISTV